MAVAPFLVSVQIEALLILNYETYTPQRWQVTLKMWAILFIFTATSIFARKVLAPLELLAKARSSKFFGTLLSFSHSVHATGRRRFQGLSIKRRMEQ